MNLITLDEYKLAKSITKGDQDQILENLITNCSAIIQKYIGRKLVDDGELIEEVFNLDYDTKSIYLEHYPVSNVTITAIDPYYYDSTVHFPVSLATYVVDAKDGRILRMGKGFWPQGYGGVKVTYNAGLPDGTDIPVELKQVTIDLVTYYLKEEYKDKSMRGATMNNFVSATEKSNGFPPHIQRVLDMFRHGPG